MENLEATTELNSELEPEIVPEPDPDTRPPFDPEAVGLARRIIDEDGFGLVDILSDSDRSELFRLGYQLFYFAVDTAHGPVNKIVSAVHDKSYNDAERWFMSKIVNNTPDLEEAVDPDPSTFPILDIDSLHVPMRDRFVFGPENVRWTESPEINEQFLDSVVSVVVDELESTGALFINDILPIIGFGKTRLGQLYGWVRGEEILIKHTRAKNGVLYVEFPNAHYVFNEIGD